MTLQPRELTPDDWQALFGRDTPSLTTITEMNTLMRKYNLLLKRRPNYCCCDVTGPTGQCRDCYSVNHVDTPAAERVARRDAIFHNQCEDLALWRHPPVDD
jgi:hypothetical protein